MSSRPIVNWELAKIVFNSFIVWLVIMGFWPMSDGQQAATISLGIAIINLVGATFQNQQTTPLVKPEDIDGTPLVRQDTMGPTRAAVRKG